MPPGSEQYVDGTRGLSHFNLQNGSLPTTSVVARLGDRAPAAPRLTERESNFVRKQAVHNGQL